jgi:hypothetical protein
MGLHVGALYNWRKAWRSQEEVMPETADVNATELSAQGQQHPSTSTISGIDAAKPGFL